MDQATREYLKKVREEEFEKQKSKEKFKKLRRQEERVRKAARFDAKLKYGKTTIALGLGKTVGKTLSIISLNLKTR